MFKFLDEKKKSLYLKENNEKKKISAIKLKILKFFKKPWFSKINNNKFTFEKKNSEQDFILKKKFQYKINRLPQIRYELKSRFVIANIDNSAEFE